MADQQSSVRDRSEIDLKEPRKYNVFFHNDDFTTFEFVELVLCEVFRKTEEEAMRLALLVDKQKRAIVGTYSYDMAVTRTKRALEMAREEGFPLNITYEVAE